MDLNPDDGGLEAFADVLSFIQPYLLPGKVDEATDLLKRLGVETRSDLLKPSFPHMESIMNLVQFENMVDLLKCKDTSDTNPKGEYILNLGGLLSKSVFQLLKGNELLSRYNRRKVINLVVDDIIENKRSGVTDSFLSKVANSLVGTYSKAFGCMEESQKPDASSAVKNSMVYHLRYMQRNSKCGIGNRATARKPKGKFSKSQSYGLVNDLPTALEGEEPAVVENRRQLLLTMYQSGNFNHKAILKLMKESYIAVRDDINDENNMEDLLSKWPFVGQADVLTDHFATLCGVSSEPNLNFLHQWVDFFRYLSHQTRKGQMKEVPVQLARLIKKWNNNEETLLILIVLCLLAHLNIPNEDVFLTFEETTSYDEIQASPLLPDHGKPVLGVLGSDLLKNPKAFLIIEKRCTSETPTTTATGLIHLIMSYFIFKISYSPRASPLLDYMQRKILKIELDGSRIERKRSDKGWSHASPAVSSKYLTLTRDFNFFMSTYQNNID